MGNHEISRMYAFIMKATALYSQLPIILTHTSSPFSSVRGLTQHKHLGCTNSLKKKLETTSKFYVWGGRHEAAFILRIHYYLGPLYLSHHSDLVPDWHTNSNKTYCPFCVCWLNNWWECQLHFVLSPTTPTFRIQSTNYNPSKKWDGGFSLPPK